MSDAVFQRSMPIRTASRLASASPWPRGFGLLLAAVASVGLWACILWIIARLLG